jgi:hypothetical protein
MTNRRDRPSDPARDDEGRPTETRVSARLESQGRGPEIVAVLIAIFVAVALVKPWGNGTSGGPRPTPRASIAPAAAPSIDPLAQLRRNCEEPIGWRVYTSERWGKLTVRSWKTIDPVHGATGPLDPTVPNVPLAAQIDALGYCSPWRDGERPPIDSVVTGWRISPEGSGAQPEAVPIDLQPVDPSWPSVLGALYGPPVNRFDPNAIEVVGWPGGRYVFVIQGPGFERWWGVAVEPPTFLAPTDGDAPTPSVAPGGRPAASTPPANP